MIDHDRLFKELITTFVIFSHDSPLRAEPDIYKVAFPDKVVLEFKYVVIQLNQLNWQDYLARPNPVASALMSKMRQLRRRVGELSPELEQQVSKLALEQIENLGESLLDFTAITDLEAWLAQHAKQQS